MARRPTRFRPCEIFAGCLPCALVRYALRTGGEPEEDEPTDASCALRKQGRCFRCSHRVAEPSASRRTIRCPAHIRDRPSRVPRPTRTDLDDLGQTLSAPRLCARAFAKTTGIVPHVGPLDPAPPRSRSHGPTPSRKVTKSV